MPWSVHHDEGKCSASKPFAVVKESDGSVVGCHASESDAESHVKALYSAMEGKEHYKAADRNQLKRYWTVGEGKAKWVGHPHPWTTLYRHLRKYVGSARAKRMASEWYHEVFGHWPNQKAKNVGKIKASLEGVEIARPGSWQLGTGDVDITEDMIYDAADYASLPGSPSVPIRLGHYDPRFDGEPAMGWVDNLRVKEDEESGEPVLIGDLSGMPEWLEASLPTAWPNRSFEGWGDYEVDGRKYGMVVDALALLGVSPPGISSIKSLRDVPKALGIAASRRIVATQRRVPPSERKDIVMDPKLIRQALGLNEDATDLDVVNAFLANSLLGNNNEENSNPPTNTNPTPAVTNVVPTNTNTNVAPANNNVVPVNNNNPVPANENDNPVPIAAGRNAPLKIVDGMVMVDAAIVTELQGLAKKGELAYKELQRQECDSVIDNAIKAGKFPPSRKEHWKNLWNQDPEGTKEYINNLEGNLIPMAASGYAGVDGDYEENALYKAVYPERFAK